MLLATVDSPKDPANQLLFISMAEISAKRQATRVTLIGMAIDIFLVFAKIIGGIYTQSFALITDGIHSLTDSITDVFVLIVARVANSEADNNHPYGHGRFETLGTITMGIMLFATAAVLIYDSVQRLRSIEELPIPAISGVAIALISIACKEWIFHYTMRVAVKLNSSLLRANAWHSRSDAVSSIAVLIGILAAQQGYLWMDTVAGVFVALIIAKVGWELCIDSLKELVDTAIPEKRRIQIEKSILEVDGVIGIENLRSRLSAGKILLDVSILVSPRITVSEGHQLAELVSQKLTGTFSDVCDVLVHVDPEPHDSRQGQDSPSRAQAPDRSQILARIRTLWANIIDEDELGEISLHILDGGIEVDLVLNTDMTDPTLAEKLASSLEQLGFISKLTIYTRSHDFRLSVTPS